MENIRVLIASHSPLQRMIGHQGHQIIHADDSVEAMTYLDAQNVDLCFLQDDLPDQSGLELCQAYSGTAGLDRVPIVIFYRQPSMESEALEKGASDFLRMPCQTREALALVENWGHMVHAPASVVEPNGTITVYQVEACVD